MARPRSGDTTNAGVYLGRVTKVDGRVCYVELPSLAAGLEYGPARYPAGYGPGAVTGENTATETLEAHAHPFRRLSAGDNVVVAFQAGRRDAIVVLAVLA